MPPDCQSLLAAAGSAVVIKQWHTLGRYRKGADGSEQVCHCLAVERTSSDGAKPSSNIGHQALLAAVGCAVVVK